MTAAPVLPLILALDVASTTGWAEGRPGEIPRTGRWVLGEKGATRPEKLFNLLRYLSDHLVVSRPRMIIIEAPLNARTQVHVGTTEETALMAFGGFGVCEAVAQGRGVYRIERARVQDVRAYFIQRRTFSGKDEGKRLVMQRCQALGWNPQGYDESDAAALWAYGAHLLAPKHCQHVEPLLIGSNGR